MFGEQFYPTPRKIIELMHSCITNRNALHYLEPSAGKGDIADFLKYRFGGIKTIDCIEIDPNLASILKGKGYEVVGDDWLTYNDTCFYDVIMMNPPFANGADHLLKAWDYMHSGEIVCLLNKSTVDESYDRKDLSQAPYSAKKKRLLSIIEKNGYKLELEDCFSTAERKTNVNVTLVYLKKESDDDSIDLWSTDKEEKTINDAIEDRELLPAIQDKLGNMELFYNDANEHMSKAFSHIRKAMVYLKANGIHTSSYSKLFEVAMGNVNDAKAELVKKHRKDAWMSVFDQVEFRNWLDKKQVEAFVQDIQKNGNVPFTRENITGTLKNIILEKETLFQQSVVNVFDSLTSYYNGNTNHNEGWKTNDSYKVNEKLIFPYGCSYSYGSFSLYRSYSSAVDIYNDLDRVICVLDGRKFGECKTIQKTLEDKFRTKFGRDEMVAESEYFHIKFFMKGTIHLKFKDKRLLQEFNKTATKGKNWIGMQTQKD